MKKATTRGKVAAVCMKAEPGLPKYRTSEIELAQNFGVKGDYHGGEFVRHRWLAELDPTMPNKRQVLLVDRKIYADIAEEGIQLEAGMLGENILIEGMSVMGLAIGAQLEVGEALLEITEIRQPCYQLNEMHPRLESVVMPEKDEPTSWNAGVMAVVLQGGRVRVGDEVGVHSQID